MKIEYVPASQYKKEQVFNWESKGCSGTWLSLEAAEDHLLHTIEEVPETRALTLKLVEAVRWCRAVWGTKDIGEMSFKDTEKPKQRYFCKERFAWVDISRMEMFSNPYMEYVYGAIDSGMTSLEHIAAMATDHTLNYETEEKTGILPMYGVLATITWTDRDGTPYQGSFDGIVYAHPDNRAVYIVARDGLDFILWAEKTSHIFDQED